MKTQNTYICRTNSLKTSQKLQEAEKAILTLQQCSLAMGTDMITNDEINIEIAAVRSANNGGKYDA